MRSGLQLFCVYLGRLLKTQKGFRKASSHNFYRLGFSMARLFCCFLGATLHVRMKWFDGSGTFLECGDDGVNACCFLQRHAFVWAFLGLSSQVFIESNNQHPIPPSRGWWSQQLPRLSPCLICAPFGKCHEESDLDSAQNIPIFDARYSRLFFVDRCFAHDVSAIALPLDIKKN